MKTLNLTWNAIKTHKRNFVFSIIFDAIFIVLFGLSQFAFFVPLGLAEAQMKTLDVISQETAKISTAEYYQLDSILGNNQDFQDLWSLMLTFIVLSLTSFVVLWLLFKLPSWLFSLKTIYSKVPFSELAFKFPLLSVFWFVVIFIGTFIFTLSTGSLIPLISPTIGLVLYVVFLFIILYFMSVSFALVPSQQTFKNTFIFGVRYAKKIFVACVFNVISIGAIFYLLYIGAKAEIHLVLFIFLFILLLITFAFARTHIIVATWQKHQ